MSAPPALAEELGSEALAKKQEALQIDDVDNDNDASHTSAAAAAAPAPGHGEGGDAVRMVETAGKGRGLVAARLLQRGTVIERAACILCSAAEYKEHLRFTVFEHYLFTCKSGNLMLPLGVGALFNHSTKPNVNYRVDEAKQTITFVAGDAIASGEELSIHYGANLWFSDADDEDPGSDEDEIDDPLPFSTDMS